MRLQHIAANFLLSNTIRLLHSHPTFDNSLWETLPPAMFYSNRWSKVQRAQHAWHRLRDPALMCWFDSLYRYWGSNALMFDCACSFRNKNLKTPNIQGQWRSPLPCGLLTASFAHTLFPVVIFLFRVFETSWHPPLFLCALLQKVSY